MRKITIIIAMLFSATSLLAQITEFNWALSEGGAGYDAGTGVTVDESGNSYISGHFRDTIIFFDNPMEFAGNTMFLSKISPDKQMLWTVTGEADGATGATGYKTYYKEGFVYVFGEFRGEAVFTSTDDNQITMQSDNRAGFVAKYSDEGQLQWITKMSTTHNTGIVLTNTANDLVVNENGDVFISTNFRHNLLIGDTLVDLYDPDNIVNTFYSILVKLDSQGNYQWHWNSTHPNNARGEGLTLTPDGNILFAVRYDNSLTVNDNLYENTGGGMALIELDNSGQHIWHHNIEASGINRSIFYDIIADNGNNIYVAGAHRNTLTWNEDNVFLPENEARTTAFVLKLNNTRELVWTRFFGDPDQNTNAQAIKLSPCGNLFLAGQHTGTMVLNDDLTLSNDNITNIFWLSMDPVSGDYLEAELFNSPSMGLFGDLAISPKNDLYVFANFMNTIEINDSTFTSEGSFDFFLVKLKGPQRHEVVFNIVDQEGDPLTGAVVTLNNIENEPGDYVFTDIEPGIYDYIIQKDGYHSAEGQINVDDDIIYDISLTLITFEVAFDLTDQDGNTVDNATITLGDLENEPGDYLFENIVPGTYDFLIQKEGYHTLEGQVNVVEDLLLEEILILITYEVSFIVSYENNEPVDDAIITFAGLENLPGDYTFENIAPGLYSYIVEKEGYITVEETIEVEDDIIINTTLIAVTYQVIFRVNLSNAIHHGLLQGFDPDVNSIYITGSMIEWEVPGTDPQNQEMDNILPDPLTYEIIFQLQAGTYEYKYFSDLLGEGFNGGEWDGGDNRTIEVTEDTTIEDLFGPATLQAGEPDGLSLTVFPNPVRHNLFIESNSEISNIRMVNILGKIVYSSNINNTTHQIHTSDLNQGIYFLQITTPNGTITRRVQVN